MRDASDAYSVLCMLSAMEIMRAGGKLHHEDLSTYEATRTELINEWMEVTDKMEKDTVRSFLDKVDSREWENLQAGLSCIYNDSHCTTAAATDDDTAIAVTNGAAEGTTTNDAVHVPVTGDKKAIAEATSSFITLLDAIKLNYDTKDTLHPLLSNVITRGDKVCSDYEGRPTLVKWLIRLNKMDVLDTLDENQLKELLWDVDAAYSAFFNSL